MSNSQDQTNGGVGPLSVYRDAVDNRYGNGLHYGVALHILLAERHLSQVIGAVLREYKLSQPHWSVLTILQLAPTEQIPLGRIANALNVHGTIITNAVDRLTDLGLAERVIDTQDRRSVLAVITAEGSRCADEIMTRLSEAQFGLSALPEKDLRSLSRILNKLSPQA